MMHHGELSDANNLDLFQPVEKPDEQTEQGRTTAGARRGSIFTQAAQTYILSAEEPTLLSALSEFVAQSAMLVVFVGLSANEMLIRDHSKRVPPGGTSRVLMYDVSSVLILSSVLSVIIGMILCKIHGESPKLCLAPKPLVQNAPISVLFTLATILKFKGIDYLSPDMVILLDQSQLFLLALAASYILKRSYSSIQLMSLVSVAMGMVQYIFLRDQQKSGVVNNGPVLPAKMLTGFTIMLLQAFVSTAAAILCEYTLKGAGSGPAVPFYIQKARLEFASGIVSLIYCYIFSPMFGSRGKVLEGPHYLLNGWDQMTLVVLLVTVAKSWAASWIAKILSSVVKQVSSCCSLLVVYLEMLALDPMKNPYNVNVLIALANVSISITSFAVSTRYTSQFTATKERLESSRRTELELASGMTS